MTLIRILSRMVYEVPKKWTDFSILLRKRIIPRSVLQLKPRPSLCLWGRDSGPPVEVMVHWAQLAPTSKLVDPHDQNVEASRKET